MSLKAPLRLRSSRLTHFTHLCSLSSHSLLSTLFLTVPSHPQHPEPPRFLSRLARALPTPSHLAFSLTDLSARTKATVTVAPKPPRFLSHGSLCSHRSHHHRRTEATVAPKPPQRTAEHPCTDLYLTDQILI
uniref:Uncharacterized protein n=1 Tax=Fagus sylvatica TaxID=28930 RepID=A0A2N9GQ11_FAGSY